MTAFHIKLIAVAAMVIDHIGLFFFPDIYALRLVGRLAFPLFAWLVANGAYHTRSMKAYLKRMFIFACISQFPFYLVNFQVDPSFFGTNVLFTFFLGLLVIFCVTKTRHKVLWFIAIAACAVLAVIIKTDYGAVGVLSVILFYFFFKNKAALVISQVLLCILGYIVAIFYQIGYIDPAGLLSIVFILLYNDKEGHKIKYFFYSFYPLQYLLIYFIKRFF